jgi:hypothetical protein
VNYIVDECFRADVEKHRWYVRKVGRQAGRWFRSYSIAAGGKYTGTRAQEMHRYVWEISGRQLPPEPLTLDHVNRDPSDNRLENIRVATERLQNLNRTQDKASGMPRGVVDVRRGRKRFRAMRPQDCGARRLLGYFLTAEEASAAYEAELARQIEIEEARVQEILNVH